MLAVVFLAMISATLVSANVIFNNYNFHDTVTYQGKTFYVGATDALSSPLGTGQWFPHVDVLIYGETVNMDAYADDLKDSFVYKLKEPGASQYMNIVNFVVDSAVESVTASGVAGYADIYTVGTSTTPVDPGIYQVDVLKNNLVVTSYELCLESFTPTGGTPVGSQTCGSGSQGGGEEPSGGTGEEGSESCNAAQVWDAEAELCISSGLAEGATVNGNEGEQNGSGNNGLPNETFIFGDGVTEGDTSTAIFNVPMINWNDQLAFRMRTQVNDIEIFGINIQDLQNGTASLNDFSIENLQNIEFNLFDNLTITDILNGNIFVGDVELPGVSINGIEFFYDFYYDINAEVNLNGESYDTVKVFFGRNPLELNDQIAEYQNVSGSLTINEKVYNLNNDNEAEENAFPIFVDRPYFVGIYGTKMVGTTPRHYTIAIKRLYTYVDQINDANRIIVNWNTSPYMSVSNTGSVPANTVKFNFSGDMQVQNQTREAAYLKFGYDAQTFRKVQIFPAPLSPQAGQNFLFNKQITNFYADAESFAVGRIEPNKMYYVGLYEGEELVYFLQAGRTPDIIDSEDEEVEGGIVTEAGSSLFNGQIAQPFSDLAQELSTGIVPCDGVVKKCDYGQVINLVRRAMNFVFIMIIPIAAIAFSYAGFLLLFQGSKPESRTKARDIFIKVFIGIVVVLAAWLIVKTILVSLGVTQTWALIDLGSN